MTVIRNNGLDTIELNVRSSKRKNEGRLDHHEN